MTIGFCCGLVCLLEISKARSLLKSVLIGKPSVGYSFKTSQIQTPVAKADLSPLRFGQYALPSQFSQGQVIDSIFGFGYVPNTNDY